LDLLEAARKQRLILIEERPLKNRAGQPRVSQRVRGVEDHRALEHLDGARVVLEREPVMVVLASQEAIVRG
jgi:hypothetical protein